MLSNDEYFMRIALDEARLAYLEGEVPVGAVIVRQGEILVREHNRKEQKKDPCAHAEFLAIQQAAQFFASWRLEDVTLYVTLEPCPMCSGAILQGRVDRLVFGTRDPKAGAVRSVFELLDDSRLNHQVEIIEGVLAEECRAILKSFFQDRRQEGKK